VFKRPRRALEPPEAFDWQPPVDEARARPPRPRPLRPEQADRKVVKQLTKALRSLRLEPGQGSRRAERRAKARAAQQARGASIEDAATGKWSEQEGSSSVGERALSSRFEEALPLFVRQVREARSELDRCLDRVERTLGSYSSIIARRETEGKAKPAAARGTGSPSDGEGAATSRHRPEASTRAGTAAPKGPNSNSVALNPATAPAQPGPSTSASADGVERVQVPPAQTGPGAEPEPPSRKEGADEEGLVSRLSLASIQGDPDALLEKEYSMEEDADILLALSDSPDAGVGGHVRTPSPRGRWKDHH